MDTEILKHSDLPFDVIVRDGDALLRHKRTLSLEPANPQLVLMALLIKELTTVSKPPEPAPEPVVVTESPKILK